MKEKFMQIPKPLRKQILLRCAGVGLGAAMLLIVLIYSNDWRFMVPCAVVAVLCLAGAAALYYQCVMGHYVELVGPCTEIERTGIRKRIKAIYLQTQDHTIRVVGIKGIRNLSVGDTVDLFLSEKTPVYDMEGCKVICNYIALARLTDGRGMPKKEIQKQ